MTEIVTSVNRTVALDQLHGLQRLRHLLQCVVNKEIPIGQYHAELNALDSAGISDYYTRLLQEKQRYYAQLVTCSDQDYLGCLDRRLSTVSREVANVCLELLDDGYFVPAQEPKMEVPTVFPEFDPRKHTVSQGKIDEPLIDILKASVERCNAINRQLSELESELEYAANNLSSVYHARTLLLRDRGLVNDSDSEINDQALFLGQHALDRKEIHLNDMLLAIGVVRSHVHVPRKADDDDIDPEDYDSWENS